LNENGMRKTVLLGLFVMLLCQNAYSQVSPSVYQQCIPKPDTLQAEHVFTVVEQMPEYSGGLSALMKYLNKSIKDSLPASEPIYGSVVITFIVDANGKVMRHSICQSSNANPSKVENQLLLAVSRMPDWKAGKQHGKNVAVRFSLPLRLGPIRNN
jgi:hypothetical protein